MPLKWALFHCSLPKSAKSAGVGGLRPYAAAARDVAQGGCDEGRIVAAFLEAGLEVERDVLLALEVIRGVELSQFRLCHGHSNCFAVSMALAMSAACVFFVPPARMTMRRSPRRV